MKWKTFQSNMFSICIVFYKMYTYLFGIYISVYISIRHIHQQFLENVHQFANSGYSFGGRSGKKSMRDFPSLLTTPSCLSCLHTKATSFQAYFLSDAPYYPLKMLCKAQRMKLLLFVIFLVLVWWSFTEQSSYFLVTRFYQITFDCPSLQFVSVICQFSLKSVPCFFSLSAFSLKSLTLQMYFPEAVPHWF